MPKRMNITVLINMPVPFDSTIDRLLQAKEHKINYIKLHEGDAIPAVSEIDWLIVMGGAMSANEEEKYPWLIPEKKLIKEVIDSGTTTLGICLGAQLITNVLGGDVYENSSPELGWHEVSPSAEIQNTLLAGVFTENKMVFHSHNETFELPDGAIRIISSEACENQAYVYKDHVVAIQFHPEITQGIAALFVQYCADEWKGSPYVQSDLNLINNESLFSQSELIMTQIMDVLEQKALSKVVHK